MNNLLATKKHVLARLSPQDYAGIEALFDPDSRVREGILNLARARLARPLLPQ